MRRQSLGAEGVTVQPRPRHHECDDFRVEDAVVGGHGQVHADRHESPAVALEDRRGEGPPGGPAHLFVAQAP